MPEPQPNAQNVVVYGDDGTVYTTVYDREQEIDAVAKCVAAHGRESRVRVLSDREAMR